MLCKDLYVIEDGLAHVVNVKGERVHSFDPTIPIACTHCKTIYPNVDCYMQEVIVRSGNGRARWSQATGFCSQACRDAWWRSASETVMAKVDRPTTLETFFCDCQAPHRSKLIANGEICIGIEGSDVIVRDRDGVFVSRHSISNQGHCELCADSRIYRPAPLFYYADEHDADWLERWGAQDFDRDIRVSVLEMDPGQWQVWDLDGGPNGLGQLRMDRVKEQWIFPHPHAVNDWFMTSISAAQQAEFRDGYEKLRLKATCG